MTGLNERHRRDGGSRTWLAFCTAWERQPLLGDCLDEWVERLSRWSDQTA